MYLDKPMKDHNLLQAICRTNRPYPSKDHGLIVDYLGIFDDVARSLNFDEKTVQQVVSNIEEFKGRLPAAMQTCMEFFPGVDRSAGGYEGLIAAQEHLPNSVLLAVRWRLREKRGFAVSHETIRAWECRVAPLLADRRGAKRRVHAGRSWSLDETDVNVAGRWCSLCRALDREGVLLDSMRRAHRDKHAARRVLRRLVDVAERKPQRVTTEAHPPYRRAIRWILGSTG